MPRRYTPLLPSSGTRNSNVRLKSSNSCSVRMFAYDLCLPGSCGASFTRFPSTTFQPTSLLPKVFQPERSLPLKSLIGSPNFTFAKSGAGGTGGMRLPVKSARPRTFPSSPTVEVVSFILSPSTLAVMVSVDFFTTVFPSASFDRDSFTRVNESRSKDADGKAVVKKSTETITAKVDGDKMKLTTSTVGDDGKVRGRADFTGKRIPPVPPAPDLAKVKFGEPIKLFNGKDLSGWKTFGSKDVGWKVVDGNLVNEAPQEPGKHKSYANIRTEHEFEDFNLTLEFRVPEDGNSGVYLRGIYEVQVANSFGRRNDSHNCGALYSRIMPSENVSKPPGEWQTFDITLVDRHLTVIHNGKKTIDNQPVLGCTGGALWSDEFLPGPIYLQGDHTSVDYRNIVLRPVMK